MRTKQPKLLWLLATAQMWKFFSEFGARAIMITFMVDRLHYSDRYTFGVYAVFCGLLQLGTIFGGVCADRFLGLRRALMLGAGLLGIGFVGLLFEQGFFPALAFIVLGSSLFTSNIRAALGGAYSENDPRRKKGFTLFFMIQNFGAMISTFLCGVIAARYGYQIGFALAASGMVMSALTLWLARRHVPQMGVKPSASVWKGLLLTGGMAPLVGLLIWGMTCEAIVLPLLPWMAILCFVLFSIKLWKDPACSKPQLRRLFVYLGALILFHAVEEQICSSLILFTERETDRTVMGWTIPGSIVMTLNPLVILIAGIAVAKRGAGLILPFILTFVAFGGLSLLCWFHVGLSVFTVLLMVGFMSVAELMVSPVVYSYASEVTTKKREGMVAGMTTLALSLSSLLAGGLGKLVAIDEGAPSLQVYGIGFGKIALLMLFGALAVGLLTRRPASTRKGAFAFSKGASSHHFVIAVAKDVPNNGDHLNQPPPCVEPPLKYLEGTKPSTTQPPLPLLLEEEC